MPVNPYLARRLHLLAGVTMDDVVRAMSGQDADLAERLRAFSPQIAWQPPDGVTITDSVARGRSHDVPVRIYRPAQHADRVVVWVHGGGFIGGDLEMGESHVVSAELAARIPAVVVAVGYRLAGPDVRHPLPIHDVSAVLKAVLEWPDTTASTVVALGGASAGAALAVSASLRAPTSVDLLLLAYPFVHFPVPALDDAHAAEMAALPPLFRNPPEAIESMVDNYVGRIHGLPADALPGAAPVPADQPPLRVVVAEYDDLRPSGELLVRQHAAAGVDTDLWLEPGVTHGHLNSVPRMPGVDDSLDWLARCVRQARPRRLRRDEAVR